MNASRSGVHDSPVVFPLTSCCHFLRSRHMFLWRVALQTCGLFLTAVSDVLHCKPLLLCIYCSMCTTSSKFCHCLTHSPPAFASTVSDTPVPQMCLLMPHSPHNLVSPNTSSASNVPSGASQASNGTFWCLPNHKSSPLIGDYYWSSFWFLSNKQHYL